MTYISQNLIESNLKFSKTNSRITLAHFIKMEQAGNKSETCFNAAGMGENHGIVIDLSLGKEQEVISNAALFSDCLSKIPEIQELYTDQNHLILVPVIDFTPAEAIKFLESKKIMKDPNTLTGDAKKDMEDLQKLINDEWTKTGKVSLQKLTIVEDRKTKNLNFVFIKQEILSEGKTSSEQVINTELLARNITQTAFLLTCETEALSSLKEMTELNKEATKIVRSGLEKISTYLNSVSAKILSGESVPEIKMDMSKLNSGTRARVANKLVELSAYFGLIYEENSAPKKIPKD